MRKHNLSKMSKYHLSRRYNLSEEDVMLLYMNNSKCSICLKTWNEVKPVVDHDHNTGKIRGLICDNCNKGIGFFMKILETCKEPKTI